MARRSLHTALQTLVARRSFLARLGAGVGVLGAAAVGASAPIARIGAKIGAQVGPQVAAPADAGASWRPARYEQDDWYDAIPGVHRFVFDAVSPEGVGSAIRFASNYYGTSEGAYGLKDAELAVLIVLRHRATSFAFSDAMWSKYSKQFDFSDPKTKRPAVVNVYAQPDDAVGDAPAGALLSLIKKGAHFAVCTTATRGLAGRIAQATGGDTDAVVKELGANFICANARFVPAGILAVNRAQEHGYSFVSAG